MIQQYGASCQTFKSNGANLVKISNYYVIKYWPLLYCKFASALWDILTILTNRSVAIIGGSSEVSMYFPGYSLRF